MWIISYALGQRVERPSDHGRKGIREADWREQRQYREAQKGLEHGEEVSGKGGDGAAGDGSVARSRNQTIKWRIEGVVPGTGSTAHDDCTENQNKVGLEERGGRASKVSGSVEGAVQMGQIEVPGPVRSVEAHEFNQGEPRGRNVRHPAILGRFI